MRDAGEGNDKDGREPMSRLEDYANKYQTVRMERRDGILQVTLHTEGQSLRWGFLPHGELPEAFHDIGGDRDNRVVILTGTGPSFPVRARRPAPPPSRPGRAGTGLTAFIGKAGTC
jgi:hypothetical protein